ncbi:hypothetical protein [Streptomyces sp. OspMP-M43]|uniref:hypothetical protein n=1 Tax=Streptomyces sp. OspMP-M43 TaxID=1839781 RepID=UPI001EFB4877|nr:hypothetical protein [Streptomyces sp. OspMP-M43]
MSSHSSGRPPTQRLFAAVLPPGTAVAALRTAVAPLHALPGAGELRWTPRAGTSRPAGRAADGGASPPQPRT